MQPQSITNPHSGHLVRRKREPNAVCLHCGKAFYRPISLLNSSKEHFCTKDCWLAQTDDPAHIAKRFWQYVEKTPTCWIWTGVLNHQGYGRFRIGGKGSSYEFAHRISWEFANGPIPDGQQALHDCPDGDNPACVNPAHLWLGNQHENVVDCWEKGRHPRAQGERSPVSKLTDEQVIAIREARAGGVPGREVARRFGISEQNVCNIFKRRSWEHLP